MANILRQNQGPGLYLVRRRVLHPLLGRWLQHDPAQADSHNLYQYGLSNPTAYVDPMGEIGVLAFVAISAAFALAETGIEYLLSTEAERERAGFGIRFLKNFGVNVATGGLAKLIKPSRLAGLASVKLFGRRGRARAAYELGRYAPHWLAQQALEVAVDTTIDVRFLGHDLRRSVFWNSVASIGGEVLVRGIGRGIKRFWNDAPGSITAGHAPARVVEARTLSQQRELARLTREVREELVNDFDALARELSPDQIRAVADEPWRMQLFFGTALEGRVAARVRQVVRSNPESVLSDVRWTGRTNAPQDFIGPNQHGFDITGGSASSIQTHFARPEVDAVVTYDSIPSDLGYRFIRWFDAR